MIKNGVFVGFFCIFQFYISGLVYALDANLEQEEYGLLNIPNDLILEIFRNADKFLVVPDEDGKKYTALPIICKRFKGIFFWHKEKMPLTKMPAPDQLPPEVEEEIEEVLKAIEKNPEKPVVIAMPAELVQPQKNKKKPSQPPHFESISTALFILPYAATMVVIVMNLLHDDLFNSYFAESDAFGQTEMVFSSLAFLTSMASCFTSLIHHYKCCCLVTKSSHFGVLLALMFHATLALGNGVNVAFSCLTQNCSLGVYFPVTAITATVASTILIFGSYELFIRNCKVKK